MSLKKRCLEMFQGDFFEKNPLLSKKIKNEIEYLRKNLKRSERVMWALKIFKYNLLGHNINELSKKDIKWCIKFEKSGILGEEYFSDRDNNNLNLPRGMRIGRYVDIRHTLKHNIDLNIAEINNIDMTNESTDVFSRMEDIENKWISESVSRSVSEYGDRVLTMLDGLTWFKLNKSGCEIESEAMKHCGNGTGKDGQELYSLRSPDPDSPGKWIPHVTLLVDDVEKGVVTEIKGYANSKPGPKYHDAIIALIKTEAIISLDGGGYKPENNFDINDLSQGQKEELYKEKPSVFHAYASWKMNDRVMNDDILSKGKREVGSSISELGSTDGKLGVVMSRGEDLYALSGVLELDNLQEMSSIISTLSVNNDFNVVISFEHQIADSLIKLKNNDDDRKPYDQMVEHLKKEFKNLIDTYDLNINSVWDVIRLHLITEYPPLQRVLRNAVNGGFQGGNTLEMLSNYNFFADSISASIPNTEFLQSTPDSEWEIVMDLQDIFKLQDSMPDNSKGKISLSNFINYSAKDYIKEYRGNVKDVIIPEGGYGGWSDELAIKGFISAVMNESFYQSRLIEEKDSMPFYSESTSAISNFIDKKTSNNQELSF